MALIIPAQFKFKPCILLQDQILRTQAKVFTVRTRKASNSTISLHVKHSLTPRFCYESSVLKARVNNDDSPVPQESSTSDTDELRASSATSGDAYVALFVRLLGIDNDPLDREQAIVALWKYSLGGKACIDNIMQFQGAINLTVNLLKSESDSAGEAAAGLLRVISSVNMYRSTVAESGAIEEITNLLRRSSLSSNVKEQSLCTLWNLSVDEKLGKKIANFELLSLFLRFLEDEDVKVKEAAGGVLANLALCQHNHKILVEVGAIPKLAKLLKTDVERTKVIRKEARNALLKMAKDDYYRILVLEEGLVLVPLVGAAAYNSFDPNLYSWPSLPDGTKIEQTSNSPSKYGASELLLGLNIEDQNLKLEEAKVNAIVGRTQQQFLARIGAVEVEDDNNLNEQSSSSERFTLLPWIDGVARLVLILGLDDESAIARAANSIADSAINEHMRVSFKEAGAVKLLIQLIDHQNSTVRLAVIRALERLSVSNYVCQTIEAEGVLHPLINLLMKLETHGYMTELILDILARILDPKKEMKSKFYDGAMNGLKKRWDPAIHAASAGHVKNIAETGPTYSLLTTEVEDLPDAAFLGRLIEILKTPSPNLQRKAASILEYVTADETLIEKIISVDIASGLDAIFQQGSLKVDEIESHSDVERPELVVLEVEEAGQALSAASRLFTRLLDFEPFRQSIDYHHFTKVLRKILISNIPLHYKDWVAACLVKLSFFSGLNHPIDMENPINIEITLYETIPRLIEQIKTSFSIETQEAAAVELNKIISEGVIDSTRAVASKGGIFPLVKLMETGSDRAVEAVLSILYNLSMDAENQPVIVSAGAIPILRRIVLSQKPYWMRALLLLRTLPT